MPVMLSRCQELFHLQRHETQIDVQYTMEGMRQALVQGEKTRRSEGYRPYRRLGLRVCVEACRRGRAPGDFLEERSERSCGKLAPISRHLKRERRRML